MKQYLNLVFRDSEDVSDISVRSLDNSDLVSIESETGKFVAKIEDLVLALQLIQIFNKKEK